MSAPPSSLPRPRDRSPTLIEDDGPASALVPNQRDRALLQILAGGTIGRFFHVQGRRAIIGRGAEVDIHLEDEGLSWRHACIRRIGDEFFIHDLGSTNGTFVDGEPAVGLTPLRDGARIGLGKRVVLKLTLQDALEAAVSAQLYQAMVRDPLTMAFNRHAFDERLRGELSFSRRHATPMTLIFMDIDHFKQINDTHGHAAGDAVLRDVTGALLRAIRAEDLLARYGGEEFAIIARGIRVPHGIAFAERMRRVVARTAVLHGDRLLHVTASFGVASTEQAGTEATALLAAADEALYEAKKTGRNRVVALPRPSADETMPPSPSNDG